jgi:uncharacterized protein YprB with RNaseH-like and TPR domain
MVFALYHKNRFFSRDNKEFSQKYEKIKQNNENSFLQQYPPDSNNFLKDFTKDSKKKKVASFNGASFDFEKIEKNTIQPQLFRAVMN